MAYLWHLRSRSNRCVVFLLLALSLSYTRCRRVTDIGHYVLPYMTMPSLLAWRATSYGNYLSASDEIRSSLYRLIARFFPSPRAVLDVMTPWGALVVGEAALSHVLHDPSVCDTRLEFAIGNLFYTPFVDRLARLLPDHAMASRVDKNAPSNLSKQMKVSRHTLASLTQHSKFPLTATICGFRRRLDMAT